MRSPVVLALTVVALAVPAVHALDLTFEERVDAQEAIERVYASHREGLSVGDRRVDRQEVASEHHQIGRSGVASGLREGHAWSDGSSS